MTHYEHRCGKHKLKRLFARGDLQLLILLQLSTKNAHGYELIRSICEMTTELYEPSPGVIYPTLSMLEDQNFIVQDPTETSRKVYMITPLGLSQLHDNAARITIIKEKLASTHHLQAERNSSRELDEATQKLKNLIRHKIRLDQISPTQMAQIVQIIDQATSDIETAYSTLAKNK